ncbi:hypothetical protein CLAFUW4_07638 [Fulvia fulva]|uniref:Uncharacterized protein n=1 Tax=Passalora fulva TaxID=5499 RepID=A0A9Q8LC92_PASFU|nr:uncharacterized protein CLAFUR5_07766 [Fulvia fulva]KAK4629222.1 hypothetical protein CLAFUR4_07643 [Fulvia fulva]KAK4630303.1 hypothetical protein CLAFUR0_07643 [Fulvia fulva]UJO14734.1 hypothetical protein CLAFUR5_07766 [Fulvia fulva]WPV12229.1 hypothetical protein CLAFUW4_07638 [Fulvia fulva]WPV28027.1 hypothetical protein CLAFUW7_07639 [Fulvia fulva]
MSTTMKTLTLAALLSLASADCILNTITTPSASDVASSIIQWNSDVNNVNAFLNSVASQQQQPGGVTDFASLSSATQTALTIASDEPCQLATLSTGSPLNDAKFACAVADLNDVFKAHVLDQLVIVRDNAGDQDVRDQAVQEINNFRCCNVLPSASTMWAQQAAANQITGVPTEAAREDACGSIICTPSCSDLS